MSKLEKNVENKESSASKYIPNPSKIKNYQNLKISTERNEEEITNSNKTEESLFSEKNEVENIYNSNNKNTKTKDEMLYREKNKEINMLKSEINKISKNKNKKVKFLTPQFVEIIDVESYKKYNEINTSKDPYDNTNENKKENKTKLICSCFII